MAFETAEDLDVFFDPEEFGETAVYNGGPVLVPVIRDQPTVDIETPQGMIPAMSLIFRIQRSDVPRPRARDELIIAGERYLLTGEPRIDRFGTIWECEAEPG